MMPVYIAATGLGLDALTFDGYNATGTLEAGITHTPADGGMPAWFAGFDYANQIVFDVEPAVIGTGDFTYSVWINKSDPGAGDAGGLDGPGSHGGFIGGSGFSIYQIRSGDSSSKSSIRVHMSPGGVDTARADDPENGGTASTGCCAGFDPLFDGNWRLFTVTRASNHYEAYFGTNNVSVPSVDDDAKDLNGVSPLHINAHHTSGRILGPTDKINKTLFYNRALTEGEIAQNLAAGPTAVVPAGSESLDAIWTTNGIGLWNDFLNWNMFSAPTTVRHTATFGDVIDNPTTVVVDTAVSINAITFDHSVSYGIAGLGSINLGANTEMPPRLPLVTVAQGEHQFQVVTNLMDDTTVDVASGSTLTFNNALNLMGKTLTKTGTGEMAIRNDLVTAGGTLALQQGTVSGNGTVSGDVNNNGGTISPGNSAGDTGNLVPEPGTLALLSLGGLLGFWAWRRSPTK